MSEPLANRADERFAARRYAARLAAVQALYQLEFGGRGDEAVIREFVDHRLADLAGEDGVDEAFFATLVRGVVREQAGVDAAIADALAEGWSLKRIDATARAILRLGAYEAIHCLDTPPAVIVSEALRLADAFFEGPEPKFIHGAVDALVRGARSPAPSVSDAG